ncbi:MAG: ECF transporter S component [Bacteroidales bacterium]
MDTEKTKEIIIRISFTSIMMALIYLSTQFLAIPYPNGGYYNLSDALIIFTAIYVGPIESIIAGTIACSLADLFGGYGVFVPFTIIAKGLEGLISFLIYYLLRNKKHIKYIALPIGALFMILTYFIAYIIMFGINYACISSLFDLIQGFSGVLIAYVLLKALKRFPLPLHNKKRMK